MKIHKEGYKIIFSFILLIAAIVITVNIFFTQQQWWHFLLYLVLLALLLFVLQFFRWPQPVIIKNKSHILCPADGEIVTIEEIKESECISGQYIQVSVFMSIWDAHLNRYPADGKIIYFKYHPGKFLVAWNPKSSTLNERTTVVMERTDGKQILLRQIAGAVARRIVCKAQTGNNVEQGEEMGFIKFGSRVDIIMPTSAKVLVKIGDKVSCGKSVIAELPFN